jgi:3-carboxy-cis,cis-muconate cycloisomerase
MMRLASHIGHEPAHEIVASATRRASTQTIDLAEALLSSELIVAKVQQHEIEAALDPHRYIGECDSSSMR